MRRVNKQELLRLHPELADEVIDVFNLEVFIYLDLFIFSLFLGLLLHPLIDSVLWSIFVPLCFFIFFFIVFQIIKRKFPDI
ncbi:hypothetical protein AC625_14100 [Peribacillus loiseleuriae]|uniref:Uncharacterized protein n=1 Tax=Peribacillus loiseleuriae TaxID=1679170 RepID=A0A0K9GV27_9BACI|nr:hypothetical protein AC625_14100 [Peribacillus loiseleuriae]